jgi:hypothetical protein
MSFNKVFVTTEDAIRQIHAQEIEDTWYYGLHNLQTDTNILPIEYELLDNINRTFKKRDCSYSYLFESEYIRAKKAGVCALLSLDGEVILPFEYEDMRRYAINDQIVVKKNGKWGLINLQKEVLIPFEYDYLGECFIAGGLVAKKNGFYGIIRPDQSVLLPFEYDKIEYEARHGSLEKHLVGEVEWLHYGVIYKNERIHFGKDYRHIDLSMYGYCGVSGTGHRRENGLTDWTYRINVTTGTLGYGKVCLNELGEELERDDSYNYSPILPENSYRYALDTLKQALQNGQTLDPKTLKKLFGKVHTWTHKYWDELAPLLNTQNMELAEQLLEIGLKKAARKQDIANGKKEFYTRGVEIIRQNTPARLEPLSQKLLDVVKKSADKTKLVADCFQLAYTVPVTPLPATIELWTAAAPILQKEYPKETPNFEQIEQILQSDLRAWIETKGLANSPERETELNKLNLLKNFLEKASKKLKTEPAVKALFEAFSVIWGCFINRKYFKKDWLNPPATETELAKLQVVLPCPIPTDLLVALRIYNGAKSGLYMNDSDMSFADVKTMLSDYLFKQNLYPEHPHAPGYLPIYSSNGNAMLLNLLDTKPHNLKDLRGQPILKGSVLNYNHEDDLDTMRVRYSSFKRVMEDLSAREEL